MGTQELIPRIRSCRDAAYASGQVLGLSGNVFEIHPTGLSEPAGNVLCRLVQDERPRTTLETGLAFGLSTLFILEGALSGPAGLGARHTAVDPFQARDWDSAGLDLIGRAGCREIVEFLEEDSALALPRMIGEGKKFDLAFIDGGHNYENVFIDLCFAHRLVRPEGLIVVDDMWMPAVRAAAAYFVRNLGSSLRTDPDPAGKRFGLLRSSRTPPQRAWDHFVPFWD